MPLGSLQRGLALAVAPSVADALVVSESGASEIGLPVGCQETGAGYKSDTAIPIRATNSVMKMTRARVTRCNSSGLVIVLIAMLTKVGVTLHGSEGIGRRRWAPGLAAG